MPRNDRQLIPGFANRGTPDTILFVLWLFLQGPTIPPPYPACGSIGGPPELDCPEGAVGYCG